MTSKEATEDDHIKQLLTMREHYFQLGSAINSSDPLDREMLRIASIIGSIDRLLVDLRRPRRLSS